MATSIRFDDTQPISEINTTPLVDVMLVLLIMFIITIPVADHKLPLDLPVPRPTEAAPPPVNRLDLDAAGRLYWNGAPIGAEELGSRLASHAADAADPVLHMNADAETRYERFDEVLAAVRGAGVDRIGFVDQSRFAAAIGG
jgi:biopolymer transport protein ExbD